jgi:chromosomal replication initiation ATPase DnaA
MRYRLKLIFSTSKTDHHNITEILLKVTLKTHNSQLLTLKSYNLKPESLFKKKKKTSITESRQIIKCWSLKIGRR